MSQQPNLFSPQAPGAPPVIADHSESSGAPEQTPRWLRRLRVVVRLCLGLVVFILPWLYCWDDNHLLVVLPHLAPLALSGITRGLVSGLGILNIYIAIHDAIHYREI